MATVPMKYLKVKDGFIALVWALDGPLNLSEQVTIAIGGEGIEARLGEVVLPILDEMLPHLLQSPRIQISFMTEYPIDDKHVMVDMDLPQLYEVKGALGILRRNAKASQLSIDPPSVVVEKSEFPDAAWVSEATA